MPLMIPKRQEISCDIHKPSSLDSDTNDINQFMLMKFYALIPPHDLWL